MKPRRTAPRKAARREAELQTRRNRAARREAAELADRYARRPVYPRPEDDTGRYTP